MQHDSGDEKELTAAHKPCPVARASRDSSND
jgi:hypothetical protein